MSSDNPNLNRHSCENNLLDESQASSRMKYLFNIHGLEENTQENLAAANGVNKFHIIIELEPNLKVKTARVFVVVKNLEKSGKILSVYPSLENILARKFEEKVEFVYLTDLFLEEVTRLVKSAGEIARVEVKEI